MAVNYAALSIDELAALCVTDADARKYAGEHFAELINRQYDELFDQVLENEIDGYEEPEPFPWLDDSVPLEWWRIG